MKNKANYLFLFIASFLFIIQSPAQNTDRRVDWLHGFGGFDNTKWSGYATRFGGDRQMTSTITSYQVTGSINSITNGISIPSNATNIGIGHSLGGIVCRNLEATGGNEVGGVITVHSPNQGASIATAVNNGEAQQFLTYVATSLTNTINSIFVVLDDNATMVNNIISFINSLIDVLNALFNAFFTDATGGAIQDVISHIGEVESPSPPQISGLIAGVFNMINNPNTQTVIDDLDPTNGFISNLDNFNSVPRIEVHGYEIDHELLRLGCSVRNKVWTSPLATTTAYPDGCNLQYLWLAQNAATAVQIYLIARIQTTPFWKDETERNLFTAMGNVVNLQVLLNGGLEAGWEDLLGTQWETVTYTNTVFSQQCQTQLNDYNSGVTSLQQNYTNCINNGGGTNCNNILSAINTIQLAIVDLQNDPGCYVTVTTDYTVPMDNSSARNDGFILESEMTTGSALATYQNLNVNHMEALNHPQTWNHFNEIFDSQTFFNTPPR